MVKSLMLFWLKGVKIIVYSTEPHWILLTQPNLNPYVENSKFMGQLT